MNEQDFKSALQDAMVTSSPPPPMDATAALEAGRRAHRRRRATWGGGVAALAVVGIAVSALVIPTLGGARPGDLPVAKPGGPEPTAIVQPATPSNPSVTGTAVPPTPSGDTKTPWPDGQTDRTATSGPRADKSVVVLNELSTALPAGYKSVDMEYADASFHGTMRRTQSQFRDYAGSGQLWEYMATTPVVKTDGSPEVGLLMAQVLTKGGDLPTDPCELTTKSWGIQGTCAVTTVAGKAVGVLTANPGSEGQFDQFDQLAAFRHDDGTVVFVAQAKEYANAGHPALAALPMTVEQLATLATNAKFKLD
jgi:hypothetical protein